MEDKSLMKGSIYERTIVMAGKNLPDIHEPIVPPMSEQKIQRILEQLWLTYYNDTLYAQGIITKSDHNMMWFKIKTRATSLK